MEKFIRNTCCYLFGATLLLGCVAAPPPKKNWDCAGAQAEYSRLLAGYEKTRLAQAKEVAKAKANSAGDLGRAIGTAIGWALLVGVPAPAAELWTPYSAQGTGARLKLVAVWKETKRLCGS